MDSISRSGQELVAFEDWGMSGRILICGDEPTLLETRYMVLVRAGFAVASTCNREEIASLPEEPGFGLAVIGRALAERDERSIVEELRRRWPGIRILFLTSQTLSLQQLSNNEYRASSLPPREFVANCRLILESSGQEGDTTADHVEPDVYRPAG
jgi:DNA-binding response OmpR family regulator